MLGTLAQTPGWHGDILNDASKIQLSVLWAH
jgi:hypothetical protein